MAGIQDFWKYEDDFFGGGTFGTSASEGDAWVIADTSSSGTPTYVRVDGSSSGEAKLTLASTAEVENVCLHHGDTLNFDIDKIDHAEFRVKQGQATIDSTTSITFGLTGDRNDAIDSIAQNIVFRLIGDNNVVVETDDGTTDTDDKSTGKTLSNTYKKFRIDFSNGTSDVRFFIDGERVAATTTFDMSGYTGSLQPFIQIQKTSDTNTDAVVVDYVYIEGTR